MENFRTRAPRSDCGGAGVINVGDTERIISAVAGGFVLLYGLSRLSLSTIIAAAAGGGLLYRGLTGHCSVYQALEKSTACGHANGERSGPRMSSLQGVTDASLAATGELPPISR